MNGTNSNATTIAGPISETIITWNTLILSFRENAALRELKNNTPEAIAAPRTR